MSRLIVKNLPQAITEEKVRELFSQHGAITDIQLKYTKEGKFRKFGFVGFRNEQEAETAIKTLHNSFINTTKITVENCALLGDASKPKSWSKYAADSTAFKKANVAKRKPSEDEDSSEKKAKPPKKQKKSNEVKELLQKYKNDPMFKEFLMVHNREDAIEELEKPTEEPTDQETEPAEELTEKIAEAPVSDMEYMNLLKKGIAKVEKQLKPKDEKKKKNFQLFTLKLIDLPYSTKKKDIKAFFKSNIPFSIRIPRQVKGIAFVGYKSEDKFKVALRKDKSFIKGRQIRVVHYVEKNDPGKAEADSKRCKWKSQEEALKNEEDIAESGRIFIRNLSYTATEKDLEDLFVKHGPLAEVNLPIDSTSRQSKGFAVVTFVMPEHAVKAYTELDGSILQGRMMHLLPGKAKDISEEEKLDESSNYKSKKAAQLKSQAGSSHNWNTLFLGHDAVAGVMAGTYGVTKDDLIGPDAKGNAAARLALGETQLVLQTRNYLEEHGVLVDMFNTAPKTRSKTVLLVKNLPPRTEAEEIRKMFGEHGELGRVILPPSGITAIVEFFEPSEARKAFLKLAYSKFKSAPLYLEWAPESSLADAKKAPVASKPPANTPEDNNNSNKDEDNENAPVEEEESEGEAEPDTTLFVKNLNFITTDEDLRKHFEGCGKLKHASVATKKDHNNPGEKLSMGYGFVQFYLKKSADNALKSMQQSVLDGKSLELKRSEKTIRTEQPTSARKATKLSKQNGSKILIRNVPFQAGANELLDLFKHFGDIKALRMPKKMDGSNSHRGFAFVDYTSEADAKNAFATLSQSTHLFGRRLVLEWASPEEGVEEIRKRTTEHFKQYEDVKSKKAVYNIE
ncbi:probable RNA-binding protein 19 [Dendroctonus ponderosae]|uniref:RRM domain-containing protein n=1 Tax=Dendroctonus ponderosae TaxID=77166 RepID=A0AAR5QC54_DENPD|nr:probable RNA-binding protein 19 [Dendroctonus ponderosae]